MNPGSKKLLQCLVHRFLQNPSAGSPNTGSIRGRPKGLPPYAMRCPLLLLVWEPFTRHSEPSPVLLWWRVQLIFWMQKQRDQAWFLASQDHRHGDSVFVLMDESQYDVSPPACPVNFLARSEGKTRMSLTVSTLHHNWSIRLTRNLWTNYLSQN